MQDLTDVALVHSWCLYVVAALESSDFIALRSLLSPINTRQLVGDSVIAVCDVLFPVYDWLM